jgi:hypothetical protein
MQNTYTHVLLNKLVVTKDAKGSPTGICWLQHNPAKKIAFVVLPEK